MLFKPMKGSSERISTDVTPFHEGWAYFTVDDGKFYIDATDAKGVKKRVCINPDSAAFVKTFSAADWVGGTLTIAKSEHGLNIRSGHVGSRVFALAGGAYTTQAFSAMDTEVSVDANKSVVLSVPGSGYAGRVILYS